MAIEPAIPPQAQPAVRPISDADRGRPETQARRDGKKRQHPQHHESTAPSPNERGQITGKVIDILA